jgi:hypothetical protein
MKKVVKDAIDYDQWAAERKNKFAVDSRDIKLHYLYTQVMEDPSTENHKALAKEISHRMKVDKTFNEIFPQYMSMVKEGQMPPITEWGCYKKMVDDFQDKCFDIGEYAMKYMGAFIAHCEEHASTPELMEKGMKDV